MRLTHVHIEHFRGIPHLTLPLDRVTVVIGENNHGKTSILDVLGLCLGRPGQPVPTHFREHDFHRPSHDGAVQPIRLRLAFSAHDTGLTPEEEELLAPALFDGRDGVARLQVEFVGMPDGRPIQTRFLDEDEEPLDPQPPQDVLTDLRRLHPVLLLRFAHHMGLHDRTARNGEGREHAEKRSERALEGEIARVYRELNHTRGPVPNQHLDQGLHAARQLFRRIEERHSGTLGPLRSMLAQLVTEESGVHVPDPDDALAHAGSGSRTLSLLMVLGALLDVRGATHLPGDSHPILAIEEPETHLHPILLASTWDVIESLSAQTLVTTHSGELLASVPMAYLRRLARKDGDIEVHQLGRKTLSERELRRVGYHIRAKRGGVLFARCWLLVEGESEFWLLRALAHVLGYDLDAEGVQCVEFAQCGVEPLVKLANDLGIEWHLLSDGDESGSLYHRDATKHLAGRSPDDRITQLERPDVERTLWHFGYADLYREAAGIKNHKDGHHRSPRSIIGKAVRNRSKPYLALSAAEAAAERGPDGVPPSLRRVIETSVRLARESIEDGRD
jgi:putative ATP-dependent endonuclease of OLD family